VSRLRILATLLVAALAGGCGLIAETAVVVATLTSGDSGGGAAPTPTTVESPAGARRA
jgi:hypothetical protein